RWRRRCWLGWSDRSAAGSRTSRRWSVCLPRHLPDRADQVVEVVRLHDGGLAALLEEAARLVARAVARDEYEALGEQGALLAQLLVQGPAAESRHLQVRHDRIEAVARGPQPLDRFEAVFDRDHLVTFALEQQAHRLTVHGVIVDDEDAQLGQRRRGGGRARQGREHALGER